MKFFFLPLFFVSALCIFSYTHLTSTYCTEYSNIIAEYCNKYNVEESLVYAIIKNESNFNPYIISQAGAKGLMQIMDSTAKYINGSDIDENYLFIPENNIKTGIKYISYLQNKFSSDSAVICSYNAGETTVRKWLENESFSSDKKEIYNTPYRTTNAYLEKVLNTKKIYEKLYNKKIID